MLTIMVLISACGRDTSPAPLDTVNDQCRFCRMVVSDARSASQIDSNRTQMSALVNASQSATGALQASQAGNQLLALQAQQLADLTATVAAQGRAQSLDLAQRTAAQDQGREQLRRFLTQSQGYQPTTVQMFH